MFHHTFSPTLSEITKRSKGEKVTTKRLSKRRYPAGVDVLADVNLMQVPFNPKITLLRYNKWQSLSFLLFSCAHASLFLHNCKHRDLTTVHLERASLQTRNCIILYRTVSYMFRIKVTHKLIECLFLL